MAPRSFGLGLAIVNILIPIAILVFARGFFPYKPFLPGLAEYNDLHLGPPPVAPFDRLVFMVVDALRSDFVYAQDSGFGFTQQLLRSGHALPFTAHARSPTVTMPRIKAMTTGSIPSFLDVILNLDESDTTATLASQDTWLAQMRERGDKLVMYGDDTWLKLFPDVFDRADGTSSFFVSDFTEVDNNVTRHIGDELQRGDWSTLILHYLGLDHIGHKSGPRSVHMPAKQREMDGIVQRIYEAMQSEPHLSSTLLVLCGDHGMNDAGNHGASSPGETSPALVFVSPKLAQLGRHFDTPAPWADDFQYYTVVEQSDIGPTLAALLGFPIPKNNLGALILDFLPFWPDARDKIRLLTNNARQILGIVTATGGISENSSCDPPLDPMKQLACDWAHLQISTPDNPAAVDAWISLASLWIKDAQDRMSSMASNYDMALIYRGMAIIAVACVGALLLSGTTALPLLAVAAPYAAMMFASSYVEEEHQFWYWVAPVWLVYLGTHASQPVLETALAVGATRVLRAWNQTGQKFAGEPDIVRTFIVTQPKLFWTLVVATFGWVFWELARRFTRRLGGGLASAVVAPVVVSAFLFKLSFALEDAPELVIEPLTSLAHVVSSSTSLITQAQVVFAGIGTLFLATLFMPGIRHAPHPDYSRASTIHHIATLLALTQSRSTNIPIFFLMHLQHRFLSHSLSSPARSLSSPIHSLPSPALITASLVVMQHVSFFAFGGTNSIASLDLSNAYNGVSGFSAPAVGVLMFLANWAGPVWWTAGGVVWLCTPSSRAVTPTKSTTSTKCTMPTPLLTHTALLTLFSATSTAAVMGTCTALRTHLFVWTVFSPKYLYTMAWALAQHLLVDLVGGAVLYALA